MAGTIVNLVGALASVATAVGVILAAVQLLLAKRQGITDFEDSLRAQYRQIARRLPLEALLGEELDKTRYQESLPDFYHNLDLSNEQAFFDWKDVPGAPRGRIGSKGFNNTYEGQHSLVRGMRSLRGRRIPSTNCGYLYLPILDLATSADFWFEGARDVGCVRPRSGRSNGPLAFGLRPITRPDVVNRPRPARLRLKATRGLLHLAC